MAPQWVIGALDAPAEQVFGRVTSIVVDSQGNMLLLDGLARELRWFDSAGSYKGRAGRPGSGPGELSEPVAMAIDSEGMVHVLDPRNARISTFQRQGERLLHAKDTRILFGSSLCALGTRRFILIPPGLGAGGRIQEIDGGGEVVAVFGATIEPDAATLRRVPGFGTLLRDAANRGRLHCDEKSRRIVLLHEELPLVRAFSGSGEEVWRTVLADYARIRYDRGRTASSLARMADPKTGAANTGTAVTTVGDQVVVTLHEGSVSDPEGRLEARVLRLSDGVEVSRSSVPFRLMLVRGDRKYVVSESPFPRVLAF